MITNTAEQPVSQGPSFVPQLDTASLALWAAALWDEESTCPQGPQGSFVRGSLAFILSPLEEPCQPPKMIYKTVSGNNSVTQQGTSHKPISRFGVQNYCTIFMQALFFSATSQATSLHLHIHYRTEEFSVYIRLGAFHGQAWPRFSTCWFSNSLL